MSAKFSTLPAAGALDGTEIVAVSQIVSTVLTSVKTTAADIAALAVKGPSSAVVDGHLAVFDGTTGKLLKDGGAVPSGGATAMNEQTGDYTLVVGDATKAIRATKATAVSITIPAGILPVLCTVPLFQGGAGAASYVAGSGVTFESPNGVATTAIGDFRTAFQRATDVWVIG